MSTRRRTVIALVMVPVVIMLSLASLGIASAHPAGKIAAKPAHKAAKITISMLMFSVPAHVKAGATIKIVNKDKFMHTVTADDGLAFDVAAPGKTTVSFKAPSTPGSYPFHCSIHTFMTGTLVVK